MKTKPLYFSGKNWNRLHIILCALTLILGGIIYILFRPKEAIFFSWIRTLGFEGLISSFRQIPQSFKLHLPEWFVYSLPNGLWAFAYALLISQIWSGSNSVFRYFWIASIPGLVLGFEILQFTGTIPGTFCFQDIALGIAGMTIGSILGSKSIKQKKS
jgi:hypothetical protein